MMFAYKGITASFHYDKEHTITICKLSIPNHGTYTGIARLKPGDKVDNYEGCRVALYNAFVHSPTKGMDDLEFISAWREDYEARHMPKQPTKPKKQRKITCQIPDGWYRLDDDDSTQNGDEMCWTHPTTKKTLRNRLMTSGEKAKCWVDIINRGYYDDFCIIRQLSKNTCQIPKGWYRLQDNELIQEGDMSCYLLKDNTTHTCIQHGWEGIKARVLSSRLYGKDTCVIRRIPRGAKMINGILMRRLENGERLKAGDYGVNKLPLNSSPWLVTGLSGAEVNYAMHMSDMEGFYRPIQKG